MNIVYFLKEYTHTTYIDSFAHSRIFREAVYCQHRLSTLVTSLQADTSARLHECEALETKSRLQPNKELKPKGHSFPSDDPKGRGDSLVSDGLSRSYEVAFLPE